MGGVGRGGGLLSEFLPSFCIIFIMVLETQWLIGMFKTFQIFLYKQLQYLGLFYVIIHDGNFGTLEMTAVPGNV